jgi:hypothetical protein
VFQSRIDLAAKQVAARTVPAGRAAHAANWPRQ